MFFTTSVNGDSHKGLDCISKLIFEGRMWRTEVAQRLKASNPHPLHTFSKPWYSVLHGMLIWNNIKGKSGMCFV